MAEAYGDSRNDKPKSSSSSSSSRTKSSSSSSSSRTKSSSSSSAGTAAENAAAKAKAKKVAELKELAKSVEKTGTELEKTSNYLAEAMQNLKKGLTGASAVVINTITETAQDAMGSVTNFINSTGSRITADLNSQGEAFTFNNTKVNTQKTDTSNNNNVFSCDTNTLKGTVVPVLEKAKKAVTNAVEEIFNSPKVEGYESVSREAEEIDGIVGCIDNILGQVKDVIGKTEQIESKNEGVLSTIGKTFSSLLGGIVLEASAAEITEPIIKETNESKNTGIGDKITEFVGDVKDFGASVLADTLNVGAQAIKGVSEFAGGLLDAGAIVGTGVASIGTLLYDGINYLITGEESSTTEQMWEDTMAFVAEEHVEAAYKDFYEAPLGSWIEKNAHDAFKSEGVVSDITSGIGKVAGVIGLTLLTLGVGTVATGAVATVGTAGTATATGVTSIFAGTSAFGDYTGEYWESSNDDSTGEKLFKGLGYGTANGAWEAAQWYVGGKLNTLNINGGSNLVTSAVRVGIDTTFNALDTPARALMDTAFTDKTFQEAFEDQGGWTSVFTNAGIGLIGSVGGEIFENAKVKDSDINVPSNSKNIIDPEHGFQLTSNDMGPFYEARLKSGFFTQEQIDNILTGVNTRGYVDEKTGTMLQKLFDDESQIFIKTVNSNDVESIMSEGIRCLGSTTSGYGNIPKNIKDIQLENTVTDVDGLLTLFQRLKGANGLSQGGNIIDGAIILKIPKDVEYEEIFKYNADLDLFNIDPKYNVGFIGTNKDGVLDSSKIFGNTQEKEVTKFWYSNYSDYKPEKFGELMDYEAECDRLLSMIKDPSAKEKCEKILCEGGFDDFSVNTTISTRNDIFIEANKRLGYASVLVSSPETAEILIQNKVNLFHGTNSVALPNIAKYGMKSGQALVEEGVDVLTGETWSRPNGKQRSFISFTDDINIALDYASLKPSKEVSEETFEVVIGASTENLEQLRHFRVHSDLPEIGIWNNVPLEKIKIIGVPKSKVEYVKKMINNDKIQVVPMEMGVISRLNWGF